MHPISAKEVNSTPNQYLVGGLIQHSTSPHSSPLVVIPKTSGGVRITVNYMKLNQIGKLSQLSIPRVDQALTPGVQNGCFLCSTWFLRSAK